MCAWVIPVFERLVELTCFLVGISRGLEQHVTTAILPRLYPSAHAAMHDLLTHATDKELTDPDLMMRLQTAITYVSQTIADGTTEERVPIPSDRLIGGALRGHSESLLTK